jgi:TnpA family transposase
MIEGAMHHGASFDVEGNMVDTHGPDIVFGLFRLLGYQFSPRIADLGGTGFWRADPPRPAARRALLH